MPILVINWGIAKNNYIKNTLLHGMDLPPSTATQKHLRGSLAPGGAAVGKLAD
jgi:hypothetical protein